MRLGTLIATLLCACSFNGTPPGGGADGSVAPDGQVAPDASAPDAPLADGSGTRCTEVDPDTVALWPFEPPPILRDATTNAHDGMFQGMGTTPIAGPPGCGDAFNFSGQSSYIHIDDDAQFDLDAGSIDLFVRVEALPQEAYGLFSRDALGSGAGGHTTIVMTPGFIAVRVQTIGVSSNRWMCSQKAPVINTWLHVAVNFGDDGNESGLELYVDDDYGVQGNDVTFSANGASFACGLQTSTGMAGNNNDIVLGAANMLAAETQLDPSLNLVGALDEVRLSSVRRNFAGD